MLSSLPRIMWLVRGRLLFKHESFEFQSVYPIIIVMENVPKILSCLVEFSREVFANMKRFPHVCFIHYALLYNTWTYPWRGLPRWLSGKKNLPANAGDLGSIPGQENPFEEEMATHLSILAWKILWTEEPGELQSIGLQRAGHDWVTEHTHP